MQVFGTLSIYLTVSSLSHSTQFPCEKGSKKEEPRSSRRLNCGNGQTSNVQTMLWRVSLSFCVERDGHHYGNCSSGLVSIPFIKKPAPHPLANSQWKEESGFFHSNTKPCKFLAPSAFTLQLAHLVIVPYSHVKRAARKKSRGPVADLTMI